MLGDEGALLLLACKPPIDEVAVAADWELLHAATFTSFSSVIQQSE